VFPLFWEKKIFACGWPVGELPFLAIAAYCSRAAPSSDDAAEGS
jgi:hypothetical protein